MATPQGSARCEPKETPRLPYVWEEVSWNFGFWTRSGHQGRTLDQTALGSSSTFGRSAFTQTGHVASQRGDLVHSSSADFCDEVDEGLHLGGGLTTGRIEDVERKHLLRPLGQHLRQPTVRQPR
jgi:hypothetical protein